MMNNRSCGCQRPRRPMECSCNCKPTCNCENVSPCQPAIMPRQPINGCVDNIEHLCSKEKGCSKEQRCSNEQRCLNEQRCPNEQKCSKQQCPNEQRCSKQQCPNEQKCSKQQCPNEQRCSLEQVCPSETSCACKKAACAPKNDSLYRQNNSSMNRPTTCGCQNNVGNMTSISCDCKCTCQHPIFPKPIDTPCPCNTETDCLREMPLAMAYVPWQPWQDVANGCSGLKQGTIFNDLVLPFHCESCRGERRCNCR